MIPKLHKTRITSHYHHHQNTMDNFTVSIFDNKKQKIVAEKNTERDETHLCYAYKDIYEGIKIIVSYDNKTETLEIDTEHLEETTDFAGTTPHRRSRGFIGHYERFVSRKAFNYYHIHVGFLGTCAQCHAHIKPLWHMREQKYDEETGAPYTCAGAVHVWIKP